MSEMTSREELDELVINILGEDHPISVMISEEAPVMFEEVLFTVMTTLVGRIDRLEAKIEGATLN